MINKKALTLVIALCFLFGFSTKASAIEANLLTSDTSKEYKIAGVYWLPDYSKGMGVIGGGSISGETSKNCSDYGSQYLSAVPSKQTCKTANPAGGLTCYTECACSSDYKYTSCPNGQKLNSDCCDNKCSACTTCTVPSDLAAQGWSYNVLTTRFRTTTPTDTACGTLYKSTDCTTYGLENEYDATRNCVGVHPNGDYSLTCYGCQSCGSQYKYDESNCPSSIGAVLSPERCGGKADGCSCPLSVTCTSSCLRSTACGGTTICLECASVTCPTGQYKSTDNVIINGICYGQFQVWKNAGSLIR